MLKIEEVFGTKPGLACCWRNAESGVRIWGEILYLVFFLLPLMGYIGWTCSALGKIQPKDKGLAFAWQKGLSQEGKKSIPFVIASRKKMMLNNGGRKFWVFSPIYFFYSPSLYLITTVHTREAICSINFNILSGIKYLYRLWSLLLLLLLCCHRLTICKPR